MWFACEQKWKSEFLTRKSKTKAKSSFMILLLSIIKSLRKRKQMLPMQSGHKFKFYERIRPLLDRKNIQLLDEREKHFNLWSTRCFRFALTQTISKLFAFWRPVCRLNFSKRLMKAEKMSNKSEFSDKVFRRIFFQLSLKEWLHELSCDL